VGHRTHIVWSRLSSAIRTIRLKYKQERFKEHEVLLASQEARCRYIAASGCSFPVLCRNNCRSSDTNESCSSSPNRLSGVRNECNSDSGIRRNNRGNRFGHFGRRRGLAFFIEERRKHYQRLNAEVFRVLAGRFLVSAGQSGLNRLQYKMRIPYDSLLFESAVAHLEKDTKLRKRELLQLGTDVEKHNVQVERLRKVLRSLMEENLVGYDDNSNLPKNGTYISDACFQVLGTAYLDRLAGSSNTHFSVGQLRVQGNLLLSDGYGIAKLATEQVADFTARLETILNDKRVIVEVDALRDLIKELNLEARESSIITETDHIVAAIDREIYRTKTKCCPTMWKLARDYMF